MQFEKTKPILERAKLCKVLIKRKLWQYITLRGMKKQSQTNPICVSPQHCWGLLKTQDEKTKPICRWTNRRKLLFERKLWEYTTLRGTKKQSQTKPICVSPQHCWGLKKQRRHQLISRMWPFSDMRLRPWLVS